MVLKATNNGLHAANGGKPNGSGKPTSKKGSRVTEARAQAQRAKLDTQAEARQQPEAEQTVIPRQLASAIILQKTTLFVRFGSITATLLRQQRSKPSSRLQAITKYPFKRFA